MNYVLDSAVGLKWVLAEPDSGRATRLRDEFNASIHHLTAPDVFTVEIANGLVIAERQNRIRAGESVIFFHDIIRTAPLIHAALPLLPRAMEISNATRQAVYDCIYVALAESLRCELVSADDLLIKKLRPQFQFLVRLADLP
jgi:predicted nucleic acid-binding protein